MCDRRDKQREEKGREERKRERKRERERERRKRNEKVVQGVLEAVVDGGGSIGKEEKKAAILLVARYLLDVFHPRYGVFALYYTEFLGNDIPPFLLL